MQACIIPHSLNLAAESSAPSHEGCRVMREMTSMPSRIGWQVALNTSANPLPVSDPKQALKHKLGNAVLTTNPAQTEGALVGSASLLAGYNAVLIKREFKKLRDMREKERREKPCAKN